MATVLDIKRMKAELARVSSARIEMEYRVEERLQEIERLKGEIVVQGTREKDLDDKIKQMEGTP